MKYLIQNYSKLSNGDRFGEKLGQLYIQLTLELNGIETNHIFSEERTGQ